MIRSHAFVGLFASVLVLPGLSRGQAANDTVLDVSYKRFTDADVAQLQTPEKLEVLVLRGHMGYGSNEVTDAGIALLVRCKNLRVLRAGGLGLSDRALESIGRLTALEELALDGNKITGTGLRQLCGLKKLRRLNLSYNPLRPDTLAAVAALPGLTHLSIQCDFPVDDRILHVCGKLTNLEELRLPERMPGVTDRGLAYLSRLRNLKNLTLVGSQNVTDAGLAKLAGLARLEEVSLRELRSVTPLGMEVLGKLASLRRLDIDIVPMDDRSVRALGQLKKLEHLLLWSVTNRPLALDALGGLSSLREFRTNQVVPSSAIRALAKLDRLESISDELTEVTDEDLKHLARLPKLRMLVLGSEHVTDAALPTLARMTALRYLYVTEKVRITPEQWAHLGRSALTQCQIGRFRPPYTVYYLPPGQPLPWAAGRP
jgi:hypothetical protein